MGGYTCVVNLQEYFVQLVRGLQDRWGSHKVHLHIQLYNLDRYRDSFNRKHLLNLNLM